MDKFFSTPFPRFLVDPYPHESVISSECSVLQTWNCIISKTERKNITCKERKKKKIEKKKIEKMKKKQQTDIEGHKIEKKVTFDLFT